MKMRVKLAIFSIAGSILICVLLGLICGAIMTGNGKSFLLNWHTGFQMFYGLVGASISIGGLLILFTKVDEANCIGDGAALFYGTLFLNGLLSDGLNYEGRKLYVVSFSNVALVCYIHCIKSKNKSK